MTYEIFETQGVGSTRTKTIHASADTLDAAIQLARSMFDVVDLEIDALNPHCADFFTRDCRVMSIEPWA